MKTYESCKELEEVVTENGKVYMPPCQIACPLKIDVQRTNVMLSLLPTTSQDFLEQLIKIGDEIYEKNPLFPICSYICGLCENECNYKNQTGAVRRRLLVRFINDYYLQDLERRPPLSTTKEKIAVIGSGPSGLACAWSLSKKGYRVTILERFSELGGALALIPSYRLPKKIRKATLSNLVRIASLEVKFGVRIGNGGKTLQELKDEGYNAIYIATGAPLPRPLTIERELVRGADLEGAAFGLELLSDMNLGKIPPNKYQGKKVIVLGGGNVAFDVARTARRLGGSVQIFCLECEDKTSKDGIPANLEEIEGASEEGIKITYCRGVKEIVGEDGKFKKIKCPRCISVFDENGMFNPKFDYTDVIEIEGDVLLITIGQTRDKAFFRQEGLLNEKNILDTDLLTLMSNLKMGVFVGGDARRVGFAAEAMMDGMIAAESIDRYLKGEDLKGGGKKEYESAEQPKLTVYKPQPELKWKSVEERLNFEPFEKCYTLEEVVEEARRCLSCGPCKSCKACVEVEFQSEIPNVEANKDLCGGCGICAPLCCYEAIKLEKSENKRSFVIDESKCKRCGLCVTACPAKALTIDDGLIEAITNVYA